MRKGQKKKFMVPEVNFRDKPLIENKIRELIDKKSK